MEPTMKPKIEYANLAPRLDTLKGKTIAIFNNTKSEAQFMLEVVEKWLIDDKRVKDIVKVNSPGAAGYDPKPLYSKMANADGVVLASAD